MRTAAALLVCAAAFTALPAAQSDVDLYRSVIEEYRQTGAVAKAVRPLLGWSAERLELSVKAVIARADTPELEAAATLHLEIGIAVAGINPASSAGYFDHASRLIAATLPPEAIRKGLSAERLTEIADVQATVLRVAASAFLSVYDVRRARPLVAAAQRIAPRSAAVLTLAGTTDEVDSSGYDPTVWDALTQRTRTGRERARLLVIAESSYKKALAIDPDYLLARIRLGRVQFLLNNLREARTSLQAGRDLAREPRHKFLAALFTGALQQTQNDLAGASKSFEQALAIMPQSQNAVAALSYAELMAGHTERAQQVAREYASATLDDAWWAYKTGALDLESLQWLRQRVRK